MFQGRYSHSLDDKKRIIIPQKLRYVLGEKFIVTKGLEKCLWVFTEDEFRIFDAKITERPMLDKDARLLQRFFIAEALEATTDIQGRVAIPANLREYASIDKEIEIVGAGNRIEIWDKQRWDDLSKEITDDRVCESAKNVGLG